MIDLIKLYDSDQKWEISEHDGITIENGIKTTGEGYIILYPISLDKYKDIKEMKITYNNIGNIKINYAVNEFEDIIPDEFITIIEETTSGQKEISFQIDVTENKYLWIKINLTNGLLDYYRLEFDLNIPLVPTYKKDIPEIEKILRGHRIERYRAILLDKNENEKGIDLNLVGGSIDINFFREIHGTATLEIEDTKNIDFINDRVKLIYEVKLSNGNWHTFNLGTFLFNLPNKIKENNMVKVNVDCFDKLIILQQDYIDQSYIIPTGTVITKEIENIIKSTGENKININQSTEVLYNDKVWQVGTNKLTIINDLLDTINYFSLWVDEYGYYRSTKYLSPEKRNVIWEFLDNEESLYLPDIVLQGNLMNVPNKIILIADQLEEEEPLIIVKTLEDIGKSNSIYSYTNRGRWIVRTEPVETSSEEILNSTAERMLIEGLQPIERIVYYHGWVPGIYPHGAIIFRNNDMGINEKYTLHAQKINLKSGNFITTTIRKVVS